MEFWKKLKEAWKNDEDLMLEVVISNELALFIVGALIIILLLSQL